FLDADDESDDEEGMSEEQGMEGAPQRDAQHDHPRTSRLRNAAAPPPDGQYRAAGWGLHDGARPAPRREAGGETSKPTLLPAARYRGANRTVPSRSPSVAPIPGARSDGGEVAGVS